MANQTRTKGTPTNIGVSRSTHALGELERMAGIGREGARFARASAAIATFAGHRWQLPMHASFPNYDDRFETALLGEGRIRVEGSRSSSDDRPLRAEVENRGPTASVRGQASAWHRAAAMVDAHERLSRQIKEPSSARGALSRVERSVELGSAAQAISTASQRATLMAVAANTESSNRARESVEANRAAFARTGFKANASSLRGVIPPANVSQREFAQPPGGVRGLNGGSVSGGLNIHSSPTVVINTTAAGGDLQRDVIGALRAHREELLDQLKRESARRERAQF